MKAAALILVLAAGIGTALADEDREKQQKQSGEQIYKQTCAACHDSGAAGAPRIGDRKAWAPRVKEGRRMMVRMAIRGIRGMPPRGGNPALSDEDVERAVVYLLNRSGAKFRE